MHSYGKFSKRQIPIVQSAYDDCVTDMSQHTWRHILINISLKGSDNGLLQQAQLLFQTLSIIFVICQKLTMFKKLDLFLSSWEGRREGRLLCGPLDGANLHQWTNQSNFLLINILTFLTIFMLHTILMTEETISIMLAFLYTYCASSVCLSLLQLNQWEVFFGNIFGSIAYKHTSVVCTAGRRY